MKEMPLLLALKTLVFNLNAAHLVCLWATLAFLLQPAQAAVIEAWVQRSNGPTNAYEYARAVAVDGSGNVVVTGSSGTIKYLANGTGVWTNRAGATVLAVDGNGNVAVTGSSTFKYAAGDGALLWEQHYPTNYGIASGVAVDGNGNVMVTGSFYGTNVDFHYYTAKYAAADGALLWEKRYNSPGNSYYARALAVDSSGNVVVAGFSAGDFYTVKYAGADGALLWEKHRSVPFHSYYDGVSALALDGNGNVVITGSSGGNYTAKYGAVDGALLWEKRSNDPWWAEAVAVDGSGNVVVTGSSGNTNFNADYYTAKYDAADGALLWEKRHNGGENSEDYAQAVAVDRSGNVVVTGYSGNYPNYDYYTAQYAAEDGALLWEKRYNGPADGDDRMIASEFFGANSHCLALGPNEMVAVTGTSDGNFGSGSASDYATVVYWENLPPVSIALVPSGIRLRFTGVPSRSYAIERAPAVTGPWTPINTQTAPLSGLLEYIDTTPPPGSAFYRTAQP
jgi:hypothetical protein